MRALRLSLTAFGPFLHTETVDFRAFRYSRLFLIQGPVGSGKTFLLDGICFAFYGRSSGGERDRRGLRNAAAQDGEETVVVLDFEVEGAGYRIERRLCLDAKSSEFRADEVALWRLPAAGEPSRRDILSSSPSGVEGMLSRMLGLSADQFCQVAILPQGQFRRFLLAPGEERTAIVRRMFDGQKYQKFADLLSQEYRELKERAEAAWKEREDLTARYELFQGDPRESLMASREELEAVVATCRQHQEKSSEWEQSLEGAVRYETLERQRDMALRELGNLANEEEAPAGALSRRLRKSLPQYRLWREKMTEKEEIERDLDEQRSQYERLKRETNFLEAEVTQARRQEEEKFALKRASEKLMELTQEAAGLQALDQEVEAAQVRLRELSRSRVTLAREVKAGQARYKKFEEDLVALRKAELRLVSLRQEVANLEDQEQRHRQQAHLQAASEEAEQRAQRLREALLSSRAALEEAESVERRQLELTRLESLQNLQADLAKGKPCPLCGSKKHPRPFSHKGTNSADADEPSQKVAELRARCQRLDEELQQAEERRLRLEGRVEESGSVTEDIEDISELTNDLRLSVSQIEGRLDEGRRRTQEMDRIKAELLPSRKRLRQMRLLRERLEATLEAALSMRASKAEVLADFLLEILDWEQGVDDERWHGLLEAENERIEAQLKVLEQVGYSTERAELMAEAFALGLAETRASEIRRATLERETNEFEEVIFGEFRLDFSNWSDLAYALSRADRESQVQSGEESVLDKETLTRTVKRQLEQSEELLTAVVTPDLRSEQIRAALARERDMMELKVARRTSLQAAVDVAEGEVERYDELVEEIRENETRLDAIKNLAVAAEGTNPGNIRFSDWVVERFFRKVIATANQKLETLAPRRFVLCLEPGLEVLVLDDNLGLRRSATTLSGGESFLASLALALGLGDVLQGDEGAADRLGTLFIDEGFGYLDDKALDAALNCLESLRSEGRTIGIVSHVAALKERIRSQVLISPADSQPAGTSRIRVFTP